MASGDNIEKMETVCSTDTKIGHSVDQYEETQFIKVCHSGDVALVKDFLDQNKGKVNERSKNGVFPLWIAASRNHGKLAEYLLQCNADVDLTTNEGTTSLFIAADRNNFGVLKILLRYGANVNLRHEQLNTTALWIACQRGYLHIVEILHKHGADINIKSEKGESALYTASEYGRVDVVAFLLENGADVHDKTIESKTPLHVASEQNHLELVKELHYAKADVDAFGIGQITPIMLAAKNGHIEIVEYLIKAGANINLCSDDPDGGTALHYASANNLMRTASLLVDREAIFKQNKGNEMPSQIAKRKKHFSISGWIAEQEDEAEANKGLPKIKSISRPSLKQNTSYRSTKTQDERRNESPSATMKTSMYFSFK